MTVHEENKAFLRITLIQPIEYTFQYRNQLLTGQLAPLYLFATYRLFIDNVNTGLV